MSVIPSEHFEDVIIDLDDGRQICISISKDGRVRCMERANKDASWGPPVEGDIYK